MRLGRFGRDAGVVRGLVDQCQDLRALSPEQQREALLSLSETTRRAIAALAFEWVLHARPEQLPPAPPWRWWVMAGGRGGGKTRPAAEQVIEWADQNPGCRIAIVGKDAGSVRRVMLGGRSGIIERSPSWCRPRWWKTDKKLEWPNGAVADLHSAEEPGTLRGPQYHFAWVGELFHWNIPRGEKEPTAWREGIKLTLRLGENPQGIIDSSPRGTEFCASFLLGPKGADGGRRITPEQRRSGDWRIEHDLVDHEGKPHRYVIAVRRWPSERNAENLSPGVVAEWRNDLRGSRLESQELDGEILERTDGALFSLEMIDAFRVNRADLPKIVRTLVAVDPTRSDSPKDEAGIVVGGLGEDGHAYVWDDRSMRGSPDAWGRAALAARSLYNAEGLVREKNRLPQSTKDLIATIDPKAKWIEVQATENKRTRAEPVAALYEQGKVHHVRDEQADGDGNRLALLEDEMVSWDARANAPSPNRMDAACWLVTALLIGIDEKPVIAAPRSVGYQRSHWRGRQ